MTLTMNTNMTMHMINTASEIIAEASWTEFSNLNYRRVTLFNSYFIEIYGAGR